MTRPDRFLDFLGTLVPDSERRSGSESGEESSVPR